MTTEKEREHGFEDFEEKIFDDEQAYNSEDDPPTGEPDDVSYLREKTFTPELKTLIDRVTHHEPKRHVEDLAGPMSEEEIIKRLHGLFYRSINLVNIDKINKTFNPFDYESLTGEDTIIKIVHEKMTEIGFPHYTLMPYHTGKRCFLPTVIHIKELDIHNIYIDSNDTLYAMIREKTDGLILDDEVINYDPLLKKRFSPLSALDENIYYMNTLKNIHNGIAAEISASKMSSSGDTDFTPVIMIEIRNAASAPDAAAICQKLRNNVSVFALFYTCHQSQKIRRAESRGYHQYFNAMEYYFRLTEQNKNIRCYSLRFEKYYSQEGYSLKSYMLAGLARNLSGKSLIINPDQYRMFVFSDTMDAAYLEKILHDWSGLFGEEFSYEVHEDPGKMGFAGFLKNMFFK